MNIIHPGGLGSLNTTYSVFIEVVNSLLDNSSWIKHGEEKIQVELHMKGEVPEWGVSFWDEQSGLIETFGLQGVHLSSCRPSTSGEKESLETAIRRIEAMLTILRSLDPPVSEINSTILSLDEDLRDLKERQSRRFVIRDPGPNPEGERMTSGDPTDSD